MSLRFVLHLFNLFYIWHLFYIFEIYITYTRECHFPWQVKIDEQERLISELESSLQRSTIETDRRLTQQQREHEKTTQLLMKQLSESSISIGATEAEAASSDKEANSR